MISDSEICQIGRIIKPHGINGEVSATIESGIELSELKCIVLKVDGINVPFFISSSRARGSEAVLITIDGIKNENEAAEISGQDVYALRHDLSESGYDDGDDGFYVSDLIGFTLADNDGTVVGEITGFDDSTANVLLTVEDKNGLTRYIPMADELIEDFDEERNIITLNLPSGILEI